MITFTRCAFMAKQACATFSQVVQKITPPIANNFLKFFVVLFVSLTLNAATAWGAEVTLWDKDNPYVASVSEKTSSNGVVKWKNSASNIYSDPTRIYKNDVLTITASNKIVKVQFVCAASDTEKYGPGHFSSNVGTYNYSGTLGTWTGEANSIEFTASGGQVRIHSVTVTYESATPAQKYKLTYQAGSVIGALEVEEGANLLDALKDITPVACDPTSADPIGWCETQITTKQATAPELLTDASVMPNKDHNVYYVFAKKETIDGGVVNNNAFSATLGGSNGDNISSGYVLTKAAETKAGYYQDGSGDVRYVQIISTSPMFTSAPNSITVTAKIGGGTGNKTLSNPVEAQLVDKDGNLIGSAVTITKKITTNTGDSYEVNVPTTGITSAYGLRISHKKESGYNVRYYSMSLSYTTSGTSTIFTDYITSCGSATYNITIADNIKNGTVTASPTSAEEGETITLTATPNTGYKLGTWNVKDASNNSVSVNENGEFTMPASNVTVSATFKQDESGEVEANSTATIVFASNANQEDGSSDVITEETEIDEVVTQGVEFVSGFADVSKVYPNSVHGLKLGTSKAIGKITIGLNISKKVSKITFKTYQYKEKEATIKFSAGGKEGSTSEFRDYTLTFDEPTTVSQIVISTEQGRAYVSQIDIELVEDEAGEGSEDPVVPTPTVNPTATFVFNTADGLAKLGIAYPTTADDASKKTNIENNTTVISNGVGLTMTGGTTTPTRVWLTASGVLDLRVYKGATLTFAVADGFEIIKVDFEGSDLTNLAVDDIPMTDAIWEGNQKSVTFENQSTVVKINTIAVTVAYTRNVRKDEYGTICIPYGSNNYTGAKFYEVSWLKEGLGLYLDELAANAELVAGKPYIFLATSDEIEIICTGEAVINPVDGKAGLTGTFTKIQDLQTSDPSNTLEGNYMIADNQIWLCGTSCWLNANRAYIKDSKLPKTEQAKIPGRRRVCMGENTTTDFENITNGENNTIKVIENGQLFIIRNGEKYNIQGVRL